MTRINKNLETSEIKDFDSRYKGEEYVTVTRIMDDFYLRVYTLAGYKSLGQNFFDCEPDPSVTFCGINEEARKILENNVKEYNRAGLGYTGWRYLLNGEKRK